MPSLKYNTELLKYIFDNANVGIAICNAQDKRIEMLNPAFAHIHGYEQEELVGVNPNEIFNFDYLKSLTKDENFGECNTNSLSIETIHTKKDGKEVNVSLHITAIKDENEQIKQFIGNVINIDERKRQEYDLKTITDNLPGFAYKFRMNSDGKEEFLYANGKVFDIYGVEPEDVLKDKSSVQSKIHPEDLIMVKSATQESAKTLQPILIRFRVNHPIKGELWLERRAIAKKNENDGSIDWYGITLDITQRVDIEKRVEFMTHHDSLTELPNRLLFEDRAKQIIANAKRNSKKVAFVFVDLDGFKAINDSLGHAVGDNILKMVSQRLQNCIRSSDTLSRQGGDEFMLIAPDIETIKEVENIVFKILDKFKKSFVINNQTISLTSSIGIAIYPDHGYDVDSLIQNADTAMYNAKERGKNTYCIYKSYMKHDHAGLFQIQNDLKSAIENNEFILHYQPQIDIKRKKIIGAEALIRWNHPTLGMVPPMSFISAAESCGLIVPIGEWVIKEACNQASIWNQTGKDIVVAVNVSPVQFKRGNLVEVVKNALEISGLNPKYLELELTESILISDAEKVLETVKAIKELGVQLSIDDFGTGYSSLAYLKRFEVDKLKIDQSFIRGLLNNKEDKSIVKTIIQMAKSFKLKSIAEGVENIEIVEILKKLGCHEVQGYHYAKPMIAEEFSHYYKNVFKNQK